MRWFLGLLVLLNVAILVWGALDDDQVEQPQLAAPGVGSIRLAGEPAAAPEPAAVPIPAPPRSSGVMTKPPADAAAENAAEPVVVEPVSATEPQVTVESPGREEAVESGKTAEETSAPVEAEPLVEAQPAAPAPPPRPKPARPRFCSLIGPFAKPADSKVLADYLRQRGGQVQLREETRSMHAGYWVMVPPLKSREAAKDVGESLKRKGITDFWVIPKGDYQYAISLGVFSKQANAAKFAERVAAKGFQVTTVDKLKQRTANWLSYQGETFIPPMEIHARVPQGVQAEDQDCP